MEVVPVRSTRTRSSALRFLPLVATIVVLAPFLIGWHWAKAGWRDHHYNYPAVPSGYTQIVNRFGEPCNANATSNWMRWTEADTGTTVRVNFHKKLGGYPTEMVTDKGGKSTNLDNDVYGHIQNDHLAPYLKHGIYTYACRMKRTANEWSTHAWGIAIDISSAYEPEGACTSTTNKNFAYEFKNHGWTWGLSFCDPMHFQYATNY
jgi:D-alanyl-D-alanine carboxypeptidase-like protein